MHLQFLPVAPVGSFLGRNYHVILLSLFTLGATITLSLFTAIQYRDAETIRDLDIFDRSDEMTAAAAREINALLTETDTTVTSTLLNSSISWLALRTDGYGLLLLADDQVLGVPNRTSSIQLSEFVSESKEADLFRNLRSGRVPNTEVIEFTEPVDGDNAWLFYQPIEGTEYGLFNVVLKHEVSFRSTEMRQALMLLSLAVLAGAFFVYSILIPVYKGRVVRLWTIAASFAVFSAAGVGFIWYLLMTSPAPEERIFIQMDQAVQTHKAHLAAKHGLNSIDVPTGIVINSLDFDDERNLTVSGLVWQRYPGGIPADLEPGIVFPDAEEYSTTLAYSIDKDPSVTIGWYFDATIKPDFDFQRFPFEREVIKIRIWHKAFSRPVFNIVDMADYTTLVPSHTPVLAPGTALEGWRINATYFSYHKFEYKSSFGIDHVGATRSAELFINIQISRDFVDPLISNLMPMSIVMVLLFSIMLIVTRDQEKARTFGFSTTAVLSYCGALLFAVILAQSDLRSGLAFEGIIYIEYFYLSGYVAILAVAVNSIVFAAGGGGRLIQARENIIPKLMFWPILTGVMLVITWTLFY